MFLGVVNPLRRAMNICPFFEGDFSNFISIFDYRMTFPDFTRHFFSLLAETVDTFIEVVLNQWTPSKKLCCFY